MASVNLGPGFAHLADTLYRFSADKSATEVAKSALGLKGAQLDYQMEREKPAYELAKMNLADTQRKEAELNSPFMVQPFVQQEIGVIDFNNPNEKAVSQYKWVSKVIPKAAEAIGAKYDPDSGTLLKADGKAMTKREWLDPLNQTRVKGVVGTFADRDKILDLDAKAGNQEAVKLLELRTKDPYTYYSQELESRLGFMNEAMVAGIPETTLGELKNQIFGPNGLYSKIDKASDLMSPEQKKDLQLKRSLVQAQIDEAKAKTTLTQEGKYETYIHKETGEVKKFKLSEAVPEGYYPKDIVATLMKANQLDSYDKIQLGQLVGEEKKYRDLYIKADNLPFEQKEEIINEYKTKRNISTGEYKNNPSKYDKAAIEEFKNGIQSRRDTLNEQIKAFQPQQTNQFGFGLGGPKQQGQPTEQNPMALRGGVPERGQGNVGGQGQGIKTLDPDTAKVFLKQAGGDKNRARELARAAGYSF